MNRRIVVNPEGLRETAGHLREKQERIAALAKDLVASAGDAQSYKDQFGPKVRALASEGSASLNAVSADVGRAIEELERIAENFEAADQETQEELAQFSIGILSHLDGLMALLAQLLPANDPSVSAAARLLARRLPEHVGRRADRLGGGIQRWPR